MALPIKVLFTCILVTIGTGYCFAVWYLFMVSVQPHVRDGHGMVQAVVEKYYGKRDVTALEAALESGGMGDEVTPTEKAQLISWLHAGATEADFAAVEPILTNSCAVCHNHEDIPSSPLTAFEEVAVYTEVDMGTSAKTLVRVSHIHVFGMTFIFTIVSGIFVMSEAKSGWRAVIVAVPFLGIWFDIGSWWITRVNPMFAYTVIIGGAVVGLSIGLQVFLSLYEIWLLPPMAPVQAPLVYAMPPAVPMPPGVYPWPPGYAAPVSPPAPPAEVADAPNGETAAAPAPAEKEPVDVPHVDQAPGAPAGEGI